MNKREPLEKPLKQWLWPFGRQTQRLLLAAMPIFAILSLHSAHAFEDTGEYLEIIKSVSGRVCFTEMERRDLRVDRNREVKLADRTIDYLETRSKSFLDAAQRVVQELNRGRNPTVGSSYNLHLSSPSKTKIPGVGRTLTAGVLCEEGHSRGCRNRNFWSSWDVRLETLTEIVIRETIRDEPLLSLCRRRATND